MIIKRCPFCGSKEVELNVIGFFFVHCLNEECKVIGPTKPTEDEAIETWNIASNSGTLMVIIGALVSGDENVQKAMEEFLNKVLE